MKVFLDANILFSAALPESHIGRFLKILGRHSTLMTSQAAVDEATRNRVRKIARLVPALRSLVQTVTITPLVADLPDVELVEKDRHILGAAVASQCSHLLTGDEKHFKHLFGTTIRGVKIVHAAMLAGEIGVKRTPP